MDRGIMEHMLVSWIREKGFSLLACLQFPRRDERDLAHFGHDTTNVEAPVGIQVIHDPVKPFDFREPAGHIAQVSREVDTGTGSAPGHR